MTRDEYEAAFSELERLMETEPAAGTDEGERLGALAEAIEAYEQVHFPIAEPTKEEAEAFRKEQERQP